MKKIFQDAIHEVKNLPKGWWIAAAILPCGIITITAYLAGKMVYKTYIKKEIKND